jgi:hypothetical protein
MTNALILNFVLAASVFAAILSLVGWAIATHHRDHREMHGVAHTPRRRARAQAHAQQQHPARAVEVVSARR